MANATRTLQVPQHVTALLSHLTSRPGVQSTLILSRKDGSIIQSTGQLAGSTSEENGSSRAQIPSSESNPLSAQSTDSSPASPALTAPSQYQPSQTEALAGHIFAFVSSASALGVSLSRPTIGEVPTGEASQDYGIGKGTTREEDRDGDAGDREEDDEVKLLRMRTRKHEIVVVPDRKYLLCVVHDAAPGPATSARSR
ncbi:hypothetical protein PENANT_c041G09426 [Penicillium antarcticum]|uniref:Roadblock/LAMTOR2 domain-containing protein n=1 Tax=Penicillium antarcticum TaxID=416450 RepID=A0A1V6PTY6_9EURO|nr:uncharacterized protein N7508_004698 [Penicillium antarcticum]KAJ5305683.1 hypothetical protein N7508_004698 [Penicillium antarcticum]OQD79956.1 hypothetical protein PENANT_c041G09426 [Penicillium antarcticum]